jgi:hypothetical protein
MPFGAMSQSLSTAEADADALRNNDASSVQKPAMP